MRNFFVVLTPATVSLVEHTNRTEFSSGKFVFDLNLLEHYLDENSRPNQIGLVFDL